MLLGLDEDSNRSSVTPHCFFHNITATFRNIKSLIPSSIANIHTMAPKRASEVFDEIDKNGDGNISKDEYTAGLVLMGVPEQISKFATESIFAQFDTNNDGLIDKDEFIKYFSDETHVTLHERIDRAKFQGNFTIFFGVYFVIVGAKLLSNPAEVVFETFPGETGNGPASHMCTILGLSWLTSGITALLQSKAVGLSSVASQVFCAIFWSSVLVYENLVGSLYGVDNFSAPPAVATVLSLSLSCYGIWSILTGQAKIKED